MAEPSRFKLIASFAAIYIIWGSTFLAIFYGIETIPPFAMAGFRFLVGGTILYLIGLSKIKSQPTRKDWKNGALQGFLLFTCGNGGLVWAEQYVPSGLASLVVATIPLWMVVIGWIIQGKAEWKPRILGGLALGFAGVLLLVGVDKIMAEGTTAIHPVGFGVIICGAIAWAAGSYYTKKVSLSSSLSTGLGMQMLCGSFFLFIISLATNEWSGFEFSQVSLRSGLALAYLIVFGTLIANSAYMYLLQVRNPVVVGTYAYVNPFIAVVLGWLLVGEDLNSRIWLAFLLIIGAVMLVNNPFAKK